MQARLLYVRRIAQDRDLASSATQDRVRATHEALNQADAHAPSTDAPTDPADAADAPEGGHEYPAAPAPANVPAWAR